MVEIDPTQKKYAVRFKPKDQRQNKTDDITEIFRAILGIADTNNILEVTKGTKSKIFRAQEVELCKRPANNIRHQHLSVTSSYGQDNTRAIPQNTKRS